MKKLLSASAFLLLSAVLVGFLRPAAPTLAAQAQPAQKEQGLESRVAALETDLAAEKRRHEETRALLEQTLVYLEKQSQAAQTLLGVLDQAEQQGFAVGENWRSRETLLAGWRAYWGDVQRGLPKLAPAAGPKPVAPARPPRR